MKPQHLYSKFCYLYCRKDLHERKFPVWLILCFCIFLVFVYIKGSEILLAKYHLC